MCFVTLFAPKSLSAGLNTRATPQPFNSSTLLIYTLSREQAHVPVNPLLTSLAVLVQAHVPVYPSHTLAVCLCVHLQAI